RQRARAGDARPHRAAAGRLDYTERRHDLVGGGFQSHRALILATFRPRNFGLGGGPILLLQLFPGATWAGSHLSPSSRDSFSCARTWRLRACRRRSSTAASSRSTVQARSSRAPRVRTLSAASTTPPPARCRETPPSTA